MKDLVIKFLGKTTDKELLDLLKQHSFTELTDEIEKAKTSEYRSFVEDVLIKLGGLVDNLDELATKKNINEWESTNKNADNQSVSDIIDTLFEMINSNYLEFDHKIYYILSLFIAVTASELSTRSVLLEFLEEQEGN